MLPGASAAEKVTVAARAQQVWDELEKLQPPDHWRPASVADPILQEAFNRAWPETERDR